VIHEVIGVMAIAMVLQHTWRAATFGRR